MNVIIIVLIFTVFLTSLFFALKYAFYKSTIKTVRKNYGEDPMNNYDERSYEFMSSYFNEYPVGDDYELDSQTWKDLQMSILFSEMDHTKSQIGSEYMYRYMRDQREKDLDALERDIQYFKQHDKERERLLYTFEKMKAVDDLQLITFIKNQSKFPFVNTFFVKLIGILALISLILVPVSIFLVPELRVVTFFSNFILLYFNQMMYTKVMHETYAVWDMFYVIAYLLDSVKLVLNNDDPIFESRKAQCEAAYNQLNSRVRVYSRLSRMSLLKYSSVGVGPFISWQFGIYGWVYNGYVEMFKQSREELLVLYETVGYYEFVISQCSYRELIDQVHTPEFKDIQGFEFEEMVHPLIDNPVANSKVIPARFIITGANASGKTTFAKTLLVNVFLAQQLNICFAKKLCFKKTRIFSSIAIEDDLIRGDSFYMVEIKRLKKYLDIASKGDRVIFFLDEILKGTNTLERIAASSTILERFVQYNCCVGLTTHDIELSKLLEDTYQNYHFREESIDGEMHYDYLIYDGATNGSNAIRLLAHCGYDQSIVDEAEKRAEHFKATGFYK